MSKKSEVPQQKRASSTRASGTELHDLRGWIDGLELEGGIRPRLHVNGADHPTALVTVDFGNPLKHVRLTPEQSQELGQRLRRAAKEILGSKDANIRVSADMQNGVHWAGQM